MNYGKNIVSLKTCPEAHRNIILALITAVTVLICVSIGSSVTAFGHIKAAQNDSYKYYTSVEIERGDTLWTIAKQYMTPEYASVQEYIEEIKTLNHLGDDAIHSGEYLMIPYFSKEIK